MSEFGLNSGFCKSPDPFVDMAVIATRSKEHADRIEGDIAGLFPAIRLNFARLSECMIVVGGNGFALDKAYISGYGRIGSEMYTSADAEVLTDFYLATEGVGQYTYFNFRRNGFDACHDFFGMGSLYTYQAEWGSLVSNRSHLAAILLSRIGDICINKDYISSLVLDYMIFSHQSFTHETPLSGLERVSLDSYVVVRNGNIDIAQSNRFNVECEPKRYDEVLRMAVQEVKDGVGEFTSQFSNEERLLVCDVSGGKDSRAAIAPLLGDSIPIAVNTVDVPNSQDLDISTQICALYGLPYDCSSSRVKRVSWKDSLSIWRSYFMGEYNRLALPEISPLGESKLLRVGGGAGEIYRDFWGKVIDVDGEPELEEVITRLIDDKNPYLKMLPEEDVRDIKDYVLNQFSHFSHHQTVKEALSDQYLYFRNRYHFGMRLFSTFHDALVYFPLLSPLLYQASRSLSWEERESGKVFFDFIAYQDPCLANLPYDGGFEYAEKNTCFDELVVSCTASDMKRQEWSDAKLRREKKRGEMIRDHNAPVNKGSIDRWLHIRVAEALFRLSAKFPEMRSLANILSKSFERKILTWPKEARTLASRIFGVDDFLFPLEEDKEWWIQENYSLDDWMTPIKDVIVKVEGTKAVVRTVLFEDADLSRYEFAFYLISDDVRVETSWYEPGRSNVEFNFSGKDFHILGFARTSTSHVFSFESQTISQES
jgi:hypothetical protein